MHNGVFYLIAISWIFLCQCGPAYPLKSPLKNTESNLSVSHHTEFKIQVLSPSQGDQVHSYSYVVEEHCLEGESEHFESETALSKPISISDAFSWRDEMGEKRIANVNVSYRRLDAQNRWSVPVQKGTAWHDHQNNQWIMPVAELVNPRGLDPDSPPIENETQKMILDISLENSEFIKIQILFRIMKEKKYVR